jgi:hypothetical protein
LKTAGTAVIFILRVHSLVQGLYFKGGRLDIPVFIIKPAPETVIIPDDKLFFQKRPVKTNQDRPGSMILHMDLERFHPAKSKPVVGQDLDHGTNRGEIFIILKRYFPAPVLPIPGIMTEEVRDTGDPYPGKDVDRFGTHPPDMINRRSKFPEKHRKPSKGK